MFDRAAGEFSAAFLWLAARNADIAAVQSTLTDPHLVLVALAILTMSVVYALQALR